MSTSLHARKGIVKITALPHCSNMAGGGGFTGSRQKLCHTRSRFGKRKECSACQLPFGKQAPFPHQNSRLITPGSFIMRRSQYAANSARRARQVKLNCPKVLFSTACFLSP